MAEYGCSDLYLTKHYIANNDTHWEPGEETTFTAYVDNIESNAECDVTVFWELDGETVAGKTKNNISGETRFIETKDHENILSSVGPGVYNMKTIIFHDGEDMVEEWWEDDNGDKSEIVIYDENGDPPGDAYNIIIEDISFDVERAVEGQSVTATITFENTGDIEGTEEFDIEVDEADTGYDVQETVEVTLESGETTSTDVTFEVGRGETANVRVGEYVELLEIVEDPIYKEDLSVSTDVNEIIAEYTAYNSVDVDVTFDVNVDVNTPSGGEAETVHDENYSITANADGTGSKTFEIGVDVPADQAREYTICVRRQ